MKKLVLSVAFLAFGASAFSAAPVSVTTLVAVTGVLQAKKPANPQKMAEKQTKTMTQELKLTPAQSTKVQAAILKRITKQQAIQRKNAGNKPAIKAAMKPVGKEFAAQLKVILTPQQLAQHNANNAAKAKARKAKGKA